MGCTFDENRAGSEGDKEATRGRGHGIGGALAVMASSPVLIGCSFRNNSAIAAIVPSLGRGEPNALCRGCVISCIYRCMMLATGSIYVLYDIMYLLEKSMSNWIRREKLVD